MTDTNPTRRTLRQREQRRAQRQHERHKATARETAARAAYAKDGIDGCVRAIGGGDADFWDQDSGEGLMPVSAQKSGVWDDE